MRGGSSALRTSGRRRVRYSVAAAGVAVVVSVAGCGSSNPPVRPVEPFDSPSPAPVPSQLTGTFETDGVGWEYLLQLSVPSGGGPVYGDVTLGRPCQHFDGSFGAQQYGPYSVGGTYSPNGVDAGGDQFNLVANDEVIDGQTVQVLGGLSSPEQGMITSSGKLVTGIAAWNPSSVSAFQQTVAAMVPAMTYCSN
jgi:hypothetical protein